MNSARRFATAIALSLTCRAGIAVAQPGTPVARSPQQTVVLSYFHEVLDGRKVDLLDTLFLADCVIHRPEGTVRGLAGIRGVVERNVAAFVAFARPSSGSAPGSPIGRAR